MMQDGLEPYETGWDDFGSGSCRLRWFADGSALHADLGFESDPSGGIAAALLFVPQDEQGAQLLLAMYQSHAGTQ